MDNDAPRYDVDRGLRAALAPPPELVARVVTHALSPSHHAPRFATRPRWSVAVAVVLVFGGTAVWWQRSARPRATPSSLTIVGSGSMLVVHGDDGRRWLIGPRAERRSAGHYVIVVPE
jgi:hypothetical protein